MKKKVPMFSRCVIFALVLLACISSLSIMTYAATVNVSSGSIMDLSDNYLSISAENGTGADYGSVTVAKDGNYIKVSITAKKSGVSFITFNTTTTVTITNISGKILNIYYGTDSSSLDTQKTVARGDSFQLSVKGKDKTTDYYLKYEVSPETFNVTFGATTNGTYTVGTTAATAGQTTVSTSAYTPTGTAKHNNITPYTLVAVPEDGYELGAWISSVDGAINYSATYSYECNQAETVYPVFKVKDCAMYYVPGDTSGIYYYSYLDDACAAASSASAKQVIAISPGKVCTSDGSPSIDIPQNVTVLLPYEYGANTISESTSTDTSGSLASTWEYANNAFISDQYDNGWRNDASVDGVLEPYTSVHLALTIPVGTTLNVNAGSKLVVGGTIVSGTLQTGGVCGATAGSHSNLIVDGTLNINSGGILSCCGYILGSGSVSIASGGTVYQPFTMVDYHDGHYTVNCSECGTFPANRYTMQNIQTDMTANSGAKIYGYIDIYTQETEAVVTTVKARHNVICQLIIGTDSDTECLVRLSSGATLETSYDSDDYVTVSSSTSLNTRGYYAKVGKTKLTITGGATLGYMKLSVNVALLGEQTVYSYDVDFPVPYNFDIDLNNGTYNLGYSLMLMPGTTMEVASDASLVVSGGTFSVMDGLRDYATTSSKVELDSTWPNYHYPSTADLQKYGYNGTANLIINGTMTVSSGASFGGYVQTNGAGTVVMNGTPSATVGIGNNSDGGDYAAIVNDNAGRTERTLSAWLWETDGDLIEMTSGTTYYGVGNDSHKVANYSYYVYTTLNTKSALQTTALNASICGSWCTIKGHGYDAEVTTEATCKSNGEMTYTCSGCGICYTNVIPATGHIDADADLKCDNCGADMGTSLAKLAAIEASADAEVLLKLKFTINDELLSDENAYVVMTKYGLETKTVRWTMADLKALGVDSKRRYVLSMGIASGEMTCPVTVQIYDGGNNPVSITDYADGNVYTTVSRTVVDYARLALAKGSDGQKKIVTYMLTYGGYAQKYFGVDTDNPAYDVLKEFDIEIPDISGISAETITQTNIFPDESVSIEKSTQIAYLDSAIYLRTYFELDSSGTYAFTLTYPANGQEYTTTMDLEKDDSRYYVDILDIPAAYLDYMYTIEAKNTTTEETFTLQTSVLAYLKLVLSQSNDTKLINLVKSMYLYNQAANEFFGK